jgi:hypothetical protein
MFGLFSVSGRESSALIASVVYRSDFLAADTGIPGSISDCTKFSA